MVKQAVLLFSGELICQKGLVSVPCPIMGTCHSYFNSVNALRNRCPWRLKNYTQNQKIILKIEEILLKIEKIILKIEKIILKIEKINFKIEKIILKIKDLVIKYF